MTMKLFISGSRSLKEIPEAARDLIDQHLHSRDEFLIGDCPAGIDRLVQDYLLTKRCATVTVYHIHAAPRYNCGTRQATHYGWFPHQAVDGGNQFHKDQAMCDDCDEAIAIWDGQSPGTKNNIAPLHILQKPVTVFKKRAG